jgi:adenylate kinase
VTKLIFIGGIHGAGKGSICRRICEQTDLIHLEASKLLKWDEISAVDNKKVENIPNTQNRLLAGLNKAIKENESYLLDGHFCLLNSKLMVEKIPLEFYVEISPRMILVVTAPIRSIKKRLELRDGRIYNSNLLKTMQTVEREYSEEISRKLCIPFFEIKYENFKEFIEIYVKIK